MTPGGKRVPAQPVEEEHIGLSLRLLTAGDSVQLAQILILDTGMLSREPAPAPGSFPRQPADGSH